MITAIRITFLILTVLFFISAIGAKSDKASYFSLAGGTILAVLLLVAMKLF